MSADRDRIIARIRKLQAVAARGGTLDEAISANRRALELIQKHGIQPAELRDPEPQRELERPVEQVPIDVEFRPGRHLKVRWGSFGFRWKL